MLRRAKLDSGLASTYSAAMSRTFSTCSCGSLSSSVLTCSRLQLRPLARFFQSTEQLETQQVSSNKQRQPEGSMEETKWDEAVAADVE